MAEPLLRAEALTRRFGGLTAVNAVSLTLHRGELHAVIGTNGAGKSTLINMLSGEMPASSGRIALAGEDITAWSQPRRARAGVGRSYQRTTIFPPLSVFENTRLCAQSRRPAPWALWQSAARCAASGDTATLAIRAAGLADVADRPAGALSHGQQRQLEIAMCLATQPRVLLLDEPLSALDLKLRQHMRSELRAIQRRVGLTFIYITHDQGEALTMSDHVAVMREGVIDQIADGRTIYDDPSTAFVASFVGENNSFTGQVSATADGMARLDTPAGPLRGRIASAAQGRLRAGDRAMLFVRPESLALAGIGVEGEDSVTGRVIAEEFEGPSCHLFLDGPGGVPLKVSLVNQGAGGAIGVGAMLTVRFDPRKAVVLPPGNLAEEE